MSRREDRTPRRLTILRRTRPPLAGRFARRPGPAERRTTGGPDGSGSGPQGRIPGWARIPGALRRPPAWQAPVAGRAGPGAARARGGGSEPAESRMRGPGKWIATAAAGVTRRLRDRLGRGLPQTLPGRVLAVLAAFVLFAGVTWMTTRSALLDVDHVRVSGGVLVTPAEAVAGAGLRRGQPMVSVDTGIAERRLRRLPWVQSAVVERAFPNIVRVHLTERVATAVASRPGGGWVLLDSGGRVLADRPERPAGLPELVGAGTAPAPGGTLAAARPALTVVAALPEELRRQVATAALNGEAVTLRVGSREIRIGTPTQLAAKVAALGVLLERLGSRAVAFVDVRVPQAPVVGPVNSNAATSTAAPGRGATDPAGPGERRD